MTKGWVKPAVRAARSRTPRMSREAQGVARPAPVSVAARPLGSRIPGPLNPLVLAGRARYGRGLDTDVFVPAGFTPPTSLVRQRLRPEPLGPQHNAADLPARARTLDHVRAPPAYPDGPGPP